MNDILKPFKEYFTMNKNGEYSHLKRTMLTVFHVRFVFVLFETLGFCKSVRVVFPDLNVTEGWINRGLFDNHTGKVLPAMKEFSLFVQPL